MILLVLSVLLVVESDCQIPPRYAGVEWPSSKYGLPKPKSGCPGGTEGVWHEGWRFQDMEDVAKPSLQRSRVSFGIASHMDVDLVGNKRDIKRHFCMKHSTGPHTRSWPKGSYCIYKSKDVACPKDMSPGWVRWDDEDYRNKNDFGGSLPDGSYDKNTIIKYCCQNQGNWYDSIELPIVQPFYLLTSSLTNTPVCQMVKWAFSYLEYIVFDTSDQYNGDRQGGSHVLIKSQDGRQIYYCYYEDCRRKITDPSGSFRLHETTNSEMVMRPRSQYCSWLITVAQTYIVSLSFRDITIPNCDDSFIRIHDGSNDTSPVLGTYCGANASTNVEISSSTNSLFIVANSGSYAKSLHKTFSFHAEYNAEHLTGCHHEFIGNTGYIKSPKFDVPSNYPRHSNCSWLVTVGDGHLVALNLSFLIDSANDVIEIYDGISENTPILARYSFINGSRNDGTLVSSTNIVYIVLKYGKSSSYLTDFVLDYASQLKPTESRTTSTLTSISTINTEEPERESAKQSKDTVYMIVPVVVGVVIVIILIAVVCFHRRRKRKAERSDELHGINPSYSWRKKSSKSDDDSVCYSNPSQPQEKVWLGGSKICKEGRNPIYQPADEQEPASLYASTDASYEPLVETNAGAAQSDNPLYGVSDVGSPHVYAEPSSQQTDTALYDEPDVKV